MHWYIIGTLVGIAALAWLYGWTLPDRHTISRSIRIAVPVARAWEVITDLPNQTAWRTHLESVKEVPGSYHEELWEERMYRRSMVFRTVEAVPPTRFVRETVPGKGASFRGRWRFDLRQLSAEECNVTLTEEGEITQPIARLFAKWFGADLFLQQYLMELALYLGEALPRWENVPLDIVIDAPQS